VDRQTIVFVFVGSAILTLICFWLHRRLAGSGEWPGPASMAAFVLGWLSVLTALLTGVFLLVLSLGH